MNISEREPCKICGSTEVDLIDGFYYCTECGTQDTNIQETVIELAFVADGITGVGVKKRITLDPGQNKQQMPIEWYKWHCMNFLIQGLAEELIQCGAEPSVKTKLLWVWTRYMKKFKKKADFGLETNERADVQENENNRENEDIVVNESDSEEEGEEIQHRKREYSVTKMSMELVISLLNVALNLDRSQIQLTHLMRFIKDGRVSIFGWVKHVPKDLRPARLKHCLLYKRNWVKHSIRSIRVVSILLFKELDLGTPLVPDLRPMIKNYMNELCLPKQLIPLVQSVISYRAFEYLDIHLHKCTRMPSYELYVIAHILFVLKLCFGLDGEYETRISNAVDKINEKENYPRAYNSEPTERLFSFQEWFKFILFRRSQLWAHTLLLGAPHYSDMDDYVAGEHQEVLADQPNEKTLRAEITWDLLNKLPLSEVKAIPKSEFPTTLTPYSTYTRVIADRMQDPTIKRALTEDFTQYSMSYFLKDMFLVDPESENPQNLLTGVDPTNFRIFSRRFILESNTLKLNYDHTMVYVKDCDNHNWMTTMRPTLDHVTTEKVTDEGVDEEDPKEDRSNDDDSLSITTVVVNDLTTVNAETDAKELLFHLKDNNIAKQNQMSYLNSISEDNSTLNDTKCETASDIQSVTTVDINEFSTLNETKIQSQTHNLNNNNIAEDNKMFELNSVSDTQMDLDLEPSNREDDLTIREEDEGVSIFDDNFEETKREIFDEDDIPNDMETNEPAFGGLEIINPYSYNKETQEYYTRRESDESSDDSITITPQTFDRNAAIKELIMHACLKYKVSLPGKYIIGKRRKPRKSNAGKTIKQNAKGVVTKLVNELIDAYNTKIEEDIFFQMSSMVQSAIADFNETETQAPMEIDEPVVENNTEENGLNEPNDVIPEADSISDIRTDEVAEERYKLFGDESDGETHAEDLLPKKNPEFDEKTHDPTQLYIKPAVDIEPPEIKLNRSLFKIIDEKINDVDRPSSPEQEESDEEDNIPLNVFRELKLIKSTIASHHPADRKRKADFIPLMSSVPCEPYFYWLKHYATNKSPWGKYSNDEASFGRELKHFPDTFVTVLMEFADVVGCQPKNIYKSLQRVELFLEDRYVKRWNLFTPHYARKVSKYSEIGSY